MKNTRLLTHVLIIITSLTMVLGCEKKLNYSKLNNDNKSVQGEVLPSIENKFLIVNYWAGWCSPCRKEISELNNFYNLHKSQVAVLGVNLESINQNELVTVINDFEIKYPVINNDLIYEQLAITTEVYPTTYVIDHKGKLLKIFTGSVTSAQLADYLS